MSSTGQNSSTLSGCECGQRDNVQGQAERRIGKVLLEMLVVLVFIIQTEMGLLSYWRLVEVSGGTSVDVNTGGGVYIVA